MKNEDNENLVTIYKTSNNALIALVKSILDEAEIKYMAKGDNIQSTYSLDVFPVEFQVMPENAEYARELLKDVDESSAIEENSSGDGETDD